MCYVTFTSKPFVTAHPSATCGCTSTLFRWLQDDPQLMRMRAADPELLHPKGVVPELYCARCGAPAPAHLPEWDELQPFEL